VLTASAHLPLKAAGFAAVVFAVATAGCLDSQDSPPGPAEDARAEGGQRPATEADNRFLEPIRPGALLATNCTGWMVRQLWPGPKPPEPHLSSWQDETPGSSVFVRGFDCKRITFAGLERGPVRMVLEDADNLEVPEECGKVEQDTAFFGLYSWGLTDPALVDQLARGLSAPTYLIDYAQRDQTGPDGNLPQIEWGPPGAEPSTLTIDAGQSTQPENLLSSRFYWANGTGVVAFDVVYDSEATVLGDRFAYGTFAAPMQLAAAYPAVFASSARWFVHQAITGTFYSWSDLQCEQPSGA
jgi:hypothetical protein